MQVLAEALPLGGNLIVADGHQGERVRSAQAGLNRLRHVGFRVGEGDGDTGDYCAGGVFERSGNVCSDLGGVDRERKSSSQKENETRETG